MSRPPPESAASLCVRPLVRGDLPFALSLSEAAGWNQTLEDWELFLELRPEGAFLASWDGEPAGTAASILYPPGVAWVAMVLVAPRFRRRGVATRLVETVLGTLEGVPHVLLDATEAGAKVYERFGFRVVAELARWRRRDARPPPKAPQGVPLLRLSPEDYPRVACLDRELFGADRSVILQRWLKRTPGAAWVAGDARWTSGYVFARDGRTAFQVGPLAAEDTQSAAALLDRALEAGGGVPAIIDVFADDRDFGALLSQRGFELERRFLRMRLGPGGLPGVPQRLKAAAGPEFG